MKLKYKIWLGVGLVIAWFLRSFFPFMFFNDDGVEVILNVPDNTVPNLHATYRSSDCQHINLYDFSLRDAKKSGRIEWEKVTENQYRTIVNYYDNSLCRWGLRSLGWSLDYIDASKVDPRATSGGGGGVLIRIEPRSTTIWGEPLGGLSGKYFEDEVLTLNQVLLPEVNNRAIGYVKGDYEVYIGAEKKLPDIYFNPFKHRDTARIEYTATIDYDRLTDVSE